SSFTSLARRTTAWSGPARRRPLSLNVIRTGATDKMPFLDVMRKKLREVHYFLERMDTVAGRAVGNPEEFEFLLRALLSRVASPERREGGQRAGAGRCRRPERRP